MRLLLSSCDLRKEDSRKCIINNIGISIDKCKVLYLPNKKAILNLIQSDFFIIEVKNLVLKGKTL